jgi:hypothetical protein
MAHHHYELVSVLVRFPELDGVLCDLFNIHAKILGKSRHVESVKSVLNPKVVAARVVGMRIVDK